MGFLKRGDLVVFEVGFYGCDILFGGVSVICVFAIWIWDEIDFFEVGVECFSALCTFFVVVFCLGRGVASFVHPSECSF